MLHLPQGNVGDESTNDVPQNAAASRLGADQPLQLGLRNLGLDVAGMG